MISISGGAPPTSSGGAGAPTLVAFDPPIAVDASETQQALTASARRVASKGTAAALDDVLNSMLPPRMYEDEYRTTWLQYVSKAPATRQDAIALEAALDARLAQRQARHAGLCPVREELYGQAFDELVRQVALDMPERGLLLLRVRDEARMTVEAYRTLYDASVTFGVRKQLQAEAGMPELEAAVAELAERKRAAESAVTVLRAKVDVAERRGAERRALDEKRRAEEVAYLKHQGRMMDGFLKLESLFTWAAAGAALAAVVRVLALRRRARPRAALSGPAAALLASGQRRVVAKLLDVGGFFGVDIGGTLTKLVFFAPDHELVGRMLARAGAGAGAGAASAGAGSAGAGAAAGAAAGGAATATSSGGARGAWLARAQSIAKLEAFIMARERYGATGVRDAPLAFHMPELGGAFHFIRFETRRMEGALRMAAAARLNAGMRAIVATGGGAMKFAPQAASLLGIALEARDEIDCLVKGSAFVMAHVPGEAYTFRGAERADVAFPAGMEYPYLLVNVGSGVGFILVTGEAAWVRVGGTSLGGGTFYGLVRSLTGIASFDDMLDAAESGDNAAVDLTVGDIYGGAGYARFGLRASTIAASFGKAVTWPSAAADALARAAAGGSGGGGGGVGGGGVEGGGGGAGAAAAAAAAAAAGGAPGGVGAATSGRAPPAEAEPAAAGGRGVAGAGSAAAFSSGAGADDGGGVAEQDGSYRSIGGPPSGARRASTARRQQSPGGGGGGSGGGGDALASPARAGAAAGAAPGDPAGVTTPPSSASRPPRGDADAPAAPGVDAAGGAGAGRAGREASPDLAPGDVARSVLIMLSNNVGQLACLVAQAHGARHVFFAGNFLRHENTIAMRTLAYSVRLWSKGALEGLFLRHEGYAGALGAFLSTLEGTSAEDR